MPRDPVWCEDCEFWHADNKSAPAWQWLCAKFPVTRGIPFLTRDVGHKDAPFRKCRDINPTGDCPCFKPKRGPQMEIADVC